jgi:hypothetical protein
VRYWLAQVGRALSRLLNAVCGGEGDCTFSAWSWHLALKGSAWGWFRVRFVDALPGNGKGHCAEAYAWHVLHDLFSEDA